MALKLAIGSDSEIESEEEVTDIKKKMEIECTAEAALLRSILAQPLRSKKRHLGGRCGLPMTTVA